MDDYVPLPQGASARHQRDQSITITFAPPGGESSRSPTSRFPSTVDAREIDRMEVGRLQSLDMREGFRSELEEIRSLRRQLNDKDEQIYAQRALIRDLEDEVRQLRRQLSIQGQQQLDVSRPTYIKVHRKYLATETLEKFQLPWDYDPNDPDYIVIKQYIDEDLQNELFEHTRRLQERERSLRGREDRILMLEERERQKRDGRQKLEKRQKEDARPINLVSRSRRRGSSSEVDPCTYEDGWRFTAPSERPKGDVERPIPRGLGGAR